MGMFIQHKLIETEHGYDLVLYIDPLLSEFAQELGDTKDPKKTLTLRESIAEYIKEKVPNIKVNSVKVMLGSMLLTTVFLVGPMVGTAEAAASTGVTSSQYAEQNVRIVVDGRTLSLPEPAVNRNGTTYAPARSIAEALGGSIWYNHDSNTVGINQGTTKIAFVVGSGTARVNGNQVSMPPSYNQNGTTMVPVRFIAEVLGQPVSWNDATSTVTIGKQATASATTYTVRSGDTLWKISNAYGLSVSQLQAMNGLTGTTIYPGQQLVVKAGTSQSTPTAPASNTVTYTTHTVQSGDNIWNLSIKYGVPQYELLKVNNLTTNSMLSIGQKITVPVHHIAVKPTVSAKHGEYLDWWTEAQYVFPINKTATVTDFQTGRTFQIKRTIGANHADSEPLTSKDAAIIKEIWGGAYSWKERAVIVQVDGRKIAASMASMPHDVDYVSGNNFNGHFDLHFKNSTRHSDGAVSEAHQRQVAIATGVQSS